MADWLTCPHCRLKHSARADGLCPRCRQPSGEAGAAASPPELPAALPPPLPAAAEISARAAASPGTMYSPSAQPAPAGIPFPPATRSQEGLAMAARLGGGVLVLNALALLWESQALPKAATGPLTAGRPVSAVIDLILGALLLLGNEKALRWSVIRIVLGAVLFAGAALVQGNGMLAFFQIAFSAALLGLLVGRAGGLRAGVSLAAVALYFTLEVGGLTGGNFLTRKLVAARSNLGRAPVTRVEGDHAKYHLTMPAGEWYLREAAAARKDNPLADLWLVRPASDAHVITIVEEVPPGARIDLERFADAVIGNQRAAATELDVLEKSTLTRPVPGRFLHTRSVVSGLRIESYYGLFVAGPRAYQIVAFAARDAFPGLSGELRQAIDSFEPPSF
jgi:hypothetical protein